METSNTDLSSIPFAFECQQMELSIDVGNNFDPVPQLVDAPTSHVKEESSALPVTQLEPSFVVKLEAPYMQMKSEERPLPPTDSDLPSGQVKLEEEPPVKIKREEEPPEQVKEEEQPIQIVVIKEHLGQVPENHSQLKAPGSLPKALEPQGSLAHSSHTSSSSTNSKGSSSTQVKKGRGVSWLKAEVIDLLAVWGDEKVQQQLRQNHRNRDLFEDIAREMRARGHNRDALECRTKTKHMRMEYKRAVTQNSSPGNSRVEIPFFKELDAIFRGNASVAPSRVSRNTDGGRTSGSTMSSIGAHSLDFFSDDVRIIDHRAPEDTGAGAMAKGQWTPEEVPDPQTQKNEDDETRTDLLLEELQPPNASQPVHVAHDQQAPRVFAGASNQNRHHTLTAVDADNEEHGDANGPEWLSPAERLTRMKAKRRRIGSVEMLNTVLRHASNENRIALQTFRESDRKMMDFFQMQTEKMAQTEERCFQQMMTIMAEQTQLLRTIAARATPVDQENSIGRGVSNTSHSSLFSPQASPVSMQHSVNMRVEIHPPPVTPPPSTQPASPELRRPLVSYDSDTSVELDEGSPPNPTTSPPRTP